MLLFLALFCIGGAVFVLCELATYPPRLRERSAKPAAESGRIRVRTSERELVHFRERVLIPAASKLAAIPLKLSPKTNVEGIGAKIVSAGLTHRLTASNFLAIKGGTTVGGVVLGLLLAAVVSPSLGLV